MFGFNSIITEGSDDLKLQHANEPVLANLEHGMF